MQAFSAISGQENSSADSVKSHIDHDGDSKYKRKSKVNILKKINAKSQES